ncbi:MAG: caspase family protein [Phaeodactylibacter sp.]|nr:caspase family protein [Phaeodactylibacter sp.]
MPKQNLYAVLIGINSYKRSPLEGCINDVLAINDYFERLCQAQSDEKNGHTMKWEPLYLLAPLDEAEAQMLKARKIKYREPTRENIIKAFDHYKKANPERGDFALLYYSGHGSYIEAPEVFADISPLGVVQTMVCYNNREAGQHDLLDKELGYLIARALHGKASFERKEGDPPGVHFLSIMDCCFSGSNTRSDEKDIKARMEETGLGVAEESAILGFTRAGNEFYVPFDKGQNRVRTGGLNHGRYVNLSAARDSEKSHEKTLEVVEEASGPRKKKHGIFTYSLLKTLEQSGSRISYRELIRRVEMEVRSKIDNQIPILGMSSAQDDNQYFFRSEFTAPKPEYEVGFREKDGRPEWYLPAGLIQGISPSDAENETSFKLTDGTERIIKATEVRSAESILDDTNFTDADKENLLLKAVIHEMPFPKIILGYGEKLPAPMKASIEEAFRTHPLHYARMAKGNEVPEFEIRPITDASGAESFILTRPGSEIPLFLRADTARNFLADVDKAGKWESVLRMSNPDTEIPREDIIVEVKKLEGVAFNLRNFGQIGESQYESLPDNPDAIAVTYKKANGAPHQPAIKLRVIHNSEFDSYWVGALYLDSQLGITHEYLPVQQIGDESGLYQVDMGFQAQGRTFEAIPLSMNAQYHSFGITETTDFIILYIARNRFDLRQYKQEPIPLDVTRGPAIEDDGGVNMDDWFTIKIPIHITRPIEAVQAAPDTSQVSGGLALQTPPGFSATFQLTNRAAARRRAEQLAESDPNPDQKIFLPPGHLWAGAEGSEAVFFRSPASRPDGHISILELTGVAGILDETRPLRITPGHALEEKEAILPFGYDAKKKQYFPLGHIDEAGDVIITRLPLATPGIIGGDGIQEEKGNNSVKLFFHKVIGKPPKGELSGFRMRGKG